LDVGEAGDLAAAAQRAGRVAAVGMQSRFSPGLRQLRRLVRDGYLGRLANVGLTAFYPTFTRPGRVPSSVWCADAGNGASSLRVHGLHSADIVRWLFGDIAEVTGAVVTGCPEWDLPSGPVNATSADSSAFVMRLESGALCSVHTSWTSWHGSGWRLAAYGSAGCLVATSAGHTGHFPVALSGARKDDQTLRRLDAPAEARDVGEMPPDSEAYPLARLLRRLVRLVGGHDEPDVPLFTDGLRMLQVAEAVERSAADGRVTPLHTIV
ncbi:MAG: Gfo/Idh/MocA family protein, partial [Carbonactinosporaceae bacterium]